MRNELLNQTDRYLLNDYPITKCWFDVVIYIKLDYFFLKYF